MNKTAIITGGGTGIGKGIAMVLIRSGYDIAITYNSSIEGAKSVQLFAIQNKRKCVCIKADISKIEEINNIFIEFQKSFNHLDLFINNAGLTYKSNFLNTDQHIFDSICNIDYRGAFFCMQYAAKLMIKNNTHGNIIAISSNNATARFADVPVYGSVKCAVNKLCKHIAVELAKYKIRVNTISPGWTDTGSSRLDDKESTYYKVPLKKWTTPQEIGNAIIFLASDYADSITGIDLVIDNGALLLSDKAEKYGL